MPMTREIAQECARESLLEILQRGLRIDPNEAIKGPIRLRLLQQSQSQNVAQDEEESTMGNNQSTDKDGTE